MILLQHAHNAFGFAQPRHSGEKRAEQFSHAARQSQAQGVGPLHAFGRPKGHAARQPELQGGKP
eukprot:16366212-Heterocapsa_arctica.AAC.1